MDTPLRLREKLHRETLAHDLIPQSAELSHAVRRLIECGRTLWRDELVPTLGWRLPGLFSALAPSPVQATLRRVGAFGYRAGEITRLCLGHPSHPRVNLASAWFSLAVSAIDTALDQKDGLSGEEVSRHLNPEAFLAAFPEDPEKPHRALDRHDLAPRLVPCVASLDVFFAHVRALYKEAEDRAYAGAVRDEMLDCLAAAVEAEVATVHLSFDMDPDDPRVLGTLRAANTLPQWLICYLVLLSVPALAPIVRTQVLEATASLAEIVWLIDDLVDCVEDLAAGTWSSVWVEVARTQPECLALLRTGDTGAALAMLLYGPVIEDLTGRIESAHRRFLSLTALDAAALLDVRAFCLFVIWSWSAPKGGSVV